MTISIEQDIKKKKKQNQTQKTTQATLMKKHA